jgi:hypothetical protein
MKDRFHPDCNEELLIDFGFDTETIARVKAVLAKRPKDNRESYPEARALPFVNLKHFEMRSRSGYYWRDWIVLNLMHEHRSGSELLIKERRQATETRRKEKENA